MTIDELLQPFQYFGVHLGLERIKALLADLGNPHRSVPIVHVAGTNGKGSICAYLSAVLAEAGYRVGRYTSPHLVDWTERICINDRSISEAELERVLVQVRDAIAFAPERETPTLFEVVTAAAWLHFAQTQVDIAIIEVGLGGRLDATNVCDRPLVTAISSLSLEHWQRLGPTLADIAREKAGILKPQRPAAIGPLPTEAAAVVRERIEKLHCPAVWVQPSQRVGEGRARYAGIDGPIEYPLPLLGEIQLTNSAVAIACVQQLQQQGWQISTPTLQAGMARARWPGRLQWVCWQGRKLLIDGAHNPAAASALRQFVDTLSPPITWVMGMLSTKDHEKIFKTLLRSRDRLYLVPVPGRSTADPEALASLARHICPDLDDCESLPDLFAALNVALSDRHQIVLCGSLYLLGYFLGQTQAASSDRG